MMPDTGILPPLRVVQLTSVNPAVLEALLQSIANSSGEFNGLVYEMLVLVVPAHIGKKFDSVTDGMGLTVAVTISLVLETHPLLVFLAWAK